MARRSRLAVALAVVAFLRPALAVRAQLDRFAAGMSRPVDSETLAASRFAQPEALAQDEKVQVYRRWRVSNPFDDMLLRAMEVRLLANGTLLLDESPIDHCSLSTAKLSTNGDMLHCHICMPLIFRICRSEGDPAAWQFYDLFEEANRWELLGHLQLIK